MIMPDPFPPAAVFHAILFAFLMVAAVMPAMRENDDE